MKIATMLCVFVVANCGVLVVVVVVVKAATMATLVAYAYEWLIHSLVPFDTHAHVLEMNRCPTKNQDGLPTQL